MFSDATPSEVEAFVRANLEKRGKEGKNLLVDCVACGKAGKMSIHEENGRWRCFVCHTTGNLFSLADRLGVRIREKVVDRRVQDLAKAFQRKAEKTETKESWPADKFGPMTDALLEDGENHLVLEYAENRGFTEETIRHFGLFASKAGGKVGLGIPFFEDDRVVLVKSRILDPGDGPKYMRRKGGKSALFNAQAIQDSNQVVIVEGELDAISLWQMGIRNVVSTSTGSGAFPDEWKDILVNVTDVVIWYDPDEAGQSGAAMVAKELGYHRCRYATLPEQHQDHKDPNGMMVALGEDKARAIAMETIDNAARIDRESVGRVSDLFDQLLEEVICQDEAFTGVSTGWPHLDECLGGGLVPREMTAVVGLPGHGKSTWCFDLACRLSTKAPTMVSSFEEGPRRLGGRLFKRVTEMTIEEANAKTRDTSSFAAHVEGFREAFFAWDLWMMKHHSQTEPEEVASDIRFAVHRHGVRFVVIDHLHHMIPEDDRVGLAEAATMFAELARELAIHIILIVQPRKSASNVIVGPQSLKGTSAIVQNADNGITIFRHHDPLGSLRGKKKGKIYNEDGEQISIELHASQSLASVWKVRRDNKSDGGNVIFTFERDRNTFHDGSEEEPEQMDFPMEEDPFLFAN